MSQDLSEAVTSLRQSLANRFRASLYDTARYACNMQDVNWQTHGDMIEALESETPRKLIVMPRGTLKSSIACVAYPIWLLIKDPNERILIDSELFTNSKNFLREIRLHLESPSLTSVFGEFKTNTWNESEIIISQRTHPYKEASISVGGVETTKVGQHYSTIIGDDYNSNQNSRTPEGRRKVIDHYRYNQSILEPDGKYVIIGTRYAEDDVIGFILKNEIQPEGET